MIRESLSRTPRGGTANPLPDFEHPPRALHVLNEHVVFVAEARERGDRCREAGLSDCSAHRLRKASARRLAEWGATTEQIKAWCGWRTAKEADRYLREVNQRKLAGAVVALVAKRPQKQTRGQVGLEPTTPHLENGRSIQLSYWRSLLTNW